MTVRGNSAAREAAQIRARARRGVWRRFLSWLGIPVDDGRTARQAAAWDAGAVGEERTKTLLRVLEAEGWRVLHDRSIPGAHSANADHVVISPGARVFLVDSKLWSAKTGTVWEDGGRLWHGREARDRVLKSLRFEAELVARALRAPVTALIAVHQAPVAGAGFFVGDVPVVPAARLVELLRGNDSPRNPGARGLADTAEKMLRPYTGRG